MLTNQNKALLIVLTKAEKNKWQIIVKNAAMI